MAKHILPLNDIKPHVEKSTCDCIPEIELINGEILVIHNSFDKREIREMLMEGIVMN